MKLSVQQLPHALRSRATAIVDFYSPTCAHCGAVPGVLKQLQARRPIDAFMVNVNEDIRTVGQLYDVRVLPTVILFQYGQEVTRTEGALDLSKALRKFGPYL